MAHTRTSGPYNSTPLSSCCNVASTDYLGRPDSKCHHCGGELTHHDDGLAERRRQVGRGNCLICGKRRGDPAVSGNCHC